MPVPIDDRVIPAVKYADPDVITTNPMMVDPITIGNGLGGTAQTLSHYSIMDLVQIFVVYAFIIAAGLSALFIFIGGINFILSGGDDEKIKKAVNTIRYSIVGLIVTILSFTFVTIVGKIFGLNFMSYLSYDKIRSSITQLMSNANTTSTGNQQQSYFKLPNK